MTRMCRWSLRVFGRCWRRSRNATSWHRAGPTEAGASGQGGGEQEFAVALGAGDGALGDAEDAPAGERCPPGLDALAHRAVNFRIAHDASAADVGGAGLELRLDERDGPGAWDAEGKGRG